jgi:preprotein translocase subunit SecE
MADKTKGKKKAAASKKRKSNAIVRLWRETVGELRKVSWPTPQEAWRLTRIVIVVMVAMSIVLGVFDTIFSRLISILYS